MKKIKNSHLAIGGLLLLSFLVLSNNSRLTIPTSLWEILFFIALGMLIIAYFRIVYRSKVLAGYESNIITSEFLEEQKEKSLEILPLLDAVKESWWSQSKSKVFESETLKRNELTLYFREHFCLKGKYTVTALDMALEKYFA